MVPYGGSNSCKATLAAADVTYRQGHTTAAIIYDSLTAGKQACMKKHETAMDGPFYEASFVLWFCDVNCLTLAAHAKCRAQAALP